MQYYCQACLRTGDSVSLMTSAEIRTYRDFVCQTSWAGAECAHMCVFCRCLLRKLARFVRQCRAAQRLLGVLQESQQPPEPIACYALQRTAPAALYAGPAPAGADSGSEDDVPLLRLRAGGAAAGGDQCEPEEAAAADAPDERPRKKKKHKKKRKTEQQKPLREGFTSRMVQETAEYLVIKLTKQQVLQELAAHAQSERYAMAPYKCARCVKGFNFEDVLLKHLEKHEPRHGELQCELCGQYCAGAVSLRGHMKSHTTRYRCKVCGLVRLSRQHVLEHHARAHAAAAPRYACQRCAFTTDKRTVMQHHARGHGAREPHACHRCGKLYKNLETLRIHITRHEAHRRQQCARCPRSFAYAAQLRRHARAVHERRDYYCVECDVPFNSRDTLKLHFQKAKRHRDPSSYKHACAQCGQRFVSAGALGTHAHRAHGAAKRARCPLCAAPRAYASREALRVHLRRAHPDARKGVSLPLADAAPGEGEGDAALAMCHQ